MSGMPCNLCRRALKGYLRWQSVSKRLRRKSWTCRATSVWGSSGCSLIWIALATGQEIDAAWDEEIRARVKAVDEGRVAGVPYEQIKKEMAERFSRR